MEPTQLPFRWITHFVSIVKVSEPEASHWPSSS